MNYPKSAKPAAWVRFPIHFFVVCNHNLIQRRKTIHTDRFARRQRACSHAINDIDQRTLSTYPACHEQKQRGK